LLIQKRGESGRPLRLRIEMERMRIGKKGTEPGAQMDFWRWKISGVDHLYGKAPKKSSKWGGVKNEGGPVGKKKKRVRSERANVSEGMNHNTLRAQTCRKKGA